jgi:nicotinamide riboside kinase
MKITIIVHGIEHTYRGDYHALHANDWNEIVRGRLDSEETTLANNKK